jgi:hypothetical protein
MRAHIFRPRQWRVSLRPVMSADRGFHADPGEGDDVERILANIGPHGGNGREDCVGHGGVRLILALFR